MMKKMLSVAIMAAAVAAPVALLKTIPPVASLTYRRHYRHHLYDQRRQERGFHRSAEPDLGD